MSITSCVEIRGADGKIWLVLFIHHNEKALENPFKLEFKGVNSFVEEILHINCCTLLNLM